MTPYERALQLKESFNHALTTRDCAMVCIDEIIEVLHGLVTSTERLKRAQKNTTYK